MMGSLGTTQPLWRPLATSVITQWPHKQSSRTGRDGVIHGLPLTKARLGTVATDRNSLVATSLVVTETNSQSWVWPCSAR